MLQKDHSQKRTIFDDFQDKLSELKIYMKQQTKLLNDNLALNNSNTEERLF